MGTFDKLLEIFAEITDSPVENITLESSITEDLGLNSIGMFYLVLAIEKEFDVILHNISIDNFKTIQDVVTFIENN